jgi:hypothetical protein
MNTYSQILYQIIFASKNHEKTHAAKNRLELYKHNWTVLKTFNHYAVVVFISACNTGFHPALFKLNPVTGVSRKTSTINSHYSIEIIDFLGGKYFYLTVFYNEA